MESKIIDFINNNQDDRIILLKSPEVVKWLFNDLSFLQEEKNNKVTKILEDTWGQNITKKRRPDLKLDKQWTNKFGEHIAEELFILCQKNISKPKKKKNYQPDLESDDCIIEVKTQTYLTKGTASEKILGCPFKYAEIPKLYSKKLLIVCIGGAEKICRESYGNLPGRKCTEEKQHFIDFFKNNGIEYVGATDILKNLVK